MLWYRQKKDIASAKLPPVEVRVVGFFSPGFVRVIIAPDHGMGHVETDWPLDWVPISARFPNRSFYFSCFDNGVPQIVEKESN